MYILGIEAYHGDAAAARGNFGLRIAESQEVMSHE